jgi:hypothetical protein
MNAHTEQTPADLRARAVASRKASQESYERCDTDGFLSQRASDTMAMVWNAQASLIESGKTYIFIGLYHNGRRVAAKQIPTKFGYTWLLRDDEAAIFGRKFIPIGNKSRVQKELGLDEQKETAPAWCGVAEGGYGVGYFRTGCQWGLDSQREGV